MSTSTSSIFNGTSTFSSDFTNVINRAVSIATLPINQLNTNVTTLTGEQTALSNLSNAFSSLQADVAAIGTAAASGNYSISYSDSTVASATASSGALLGTYNLNVTDAGSQATAVSTATVTDPTTRNISSATSFTLTANGQTYSNIMPPPNANTLTGLVSAINTATQGAVRATIINIGTSSAPQYELSVQNTAYGSLPITLTDNNGIDLLGDATIPNSVEYTLNGQSLSSNSRTLSVSPNLSVDVLTTGPTTITVGQATTSIANALTTFVRDYNAASQALTAQRGTSGGALAGQSVVNTLSQALQNIANYSGSGSVQSMAQLGLTFNDNTGVLSFDPTVLSAAGANDFAGVTSFLGGPTTGGFLQAATNSLTSLLDANSGAIPTLLNSIAGEITYTNNQISTDQDRVNQMQTNLTAQMSAADAAIASMQQQITYMTSLFTAMTANQNQNTLG
jgi:flagellar hook-associated protein 2